MEKSGNKRYLVTWSDGKTDLTKASNLLGITADKCKAGVSFMETDAIPGKDDVMHFENLGITSMELTSDEAVNLLEKDGILAVEEDTEMHILELPQNEEYNSFLGSNANLEPIPSESPDFRNGYNKALTDIFASMLKLGQSDPQTAAIAGNPVPGPFFWPFPILKKQAIPWNINLVKAPQAWARGFNGSGIKVAVLDTGIATHPDLVVAGGVSFIPGVVSYNDGNSHGTHCAGIIGARNNWIGVVGVAPLCELYAVKVLADSGSGSSSGIIAGMEWCITNGIKVASMSLGSTSGPSVAWANAIKHCQDNGVTVVCASGNSYVDTSPVFPWVNAPANSFVMGARTASPIAVGAVDLASLIAYFSSRGGQNENWNQVTLVAPGVNINSTIPGNGYGKKSGTSMATPHVAGIAALVCQRFPGILPVGVKARLAQTATNLGPAGFDLTYGYGLINCDSATL